MRARDAQRFLRRAFAAQSPGSKIRVLLAPFAPDERRRLLWFVQRHHWRSLIATGVFIGLSISCWSLVLIEYSIRHIPAQASLSAWADHNPGEAVRTIAILFSLLACGPLAGLSARDHWLLRVLTKHVREACCVDCAYALADIPVDDEQRICPECGGLEIVIPNRGLIPARLLPSR